MSDLAQHGKKAVLALACIGALGTGALVGASVVSAAPKSSNCTYYADETYTTVVGQFGYDCCNNKVARGQKTPYVDCSPACFICLPPGR